MKTLRSQKLRMLLTPSPAATVEGNRYRERPARTLRNFGLKVGMVGKVKFEARIRSLSRTSPTWRCFMPGPGLWTGGLAVSL